MAKELRTLTFPGLSDTYSTSAGGSGMSPILKVQIYSDETGSYTPNVSFTSTIPGINLDSILIPYLTDSAHYWYKIPTYGSCSVSWDHEDVDPVTVSVDRVSVYTATPVAGPKWRTVWTGTWTKTKTGSISSTTATFSDATLKSGVPLRITGGGNNGEDFTFVEKEINSTSTTLHTWSQSTGQGGAGGTTSATFKNSTLSINMNASASSPGGTTYIDCTTTITKIEQYY